LSLGVLTGQDDLRALLFAALDRDGAERDEVMVASPPTRFFVPRGEDVAAAVSPADGLLLLVRFMDVLTMDRLKKIREQLPTDPVKPMAVLLFREPDEIDFKMSCPACGQKLWVRDTDEGKRGRCPNCKTAFHLPSQPQHAKVELALHADIPVIRVVGKDGRSCRNALENLRGHLAGDTRPPFDPEVLLRSTAKIEVPPETKSSEA
jgi:hypothetical protein